MVNVDAACCCAVEGDVLRAVETFPLLITTQAFTTPRDVDSRVLLPYEQPFQIAIVANVQQTRRKDGIACLASYHFMIALCRARKRESAA